MRMPKIQECVVRYGIVWYDVVIVVSYYMMS